MTVHDRISCMISWYSKSSVFVRPHHIRKRGVGVFEIDSGTVYENLCFGALNKMPFTCGQKAKTRKKSPFPKKKKNSDVWMGPKPSPLRWIAIAAQFLRAYANKFYERK